MLYINISEFPIDYFRKYYNFIYITILIPEYLGQTLKIEYIYFNGVVVAINVPTNGISTIYYVFNDHLGTPRAITDTSGNAQWIWENVEPFGDNAPVKVNAGFIDFNLRFPGQYYDGESGLNYNYHRDYNSSVGRYVQSDPIGLNGGINTYGYVRSNTLGFIDPEGLLSYDVYKLVCDYLKQSNNSLYLAWQLSLEKRQEPNKWKKKNLRMAENFLYAKMSVQEYNDSYILMNSGIIGHSLLKPYLAPFGLTSEFSFEALFVGLEGAKSGKEKEILKCECEK